MVCDGESFHVFVSVQPNTKQHSVTEMCKQGKRHFPIAQNASQLTVLWRPCCGQKQEVLLWNYMSLKQTLCIQIVPSLCTFHFLSLLDMNYVVCSDWLKCFNCWLSFPLPRIVDNLKYAGMLQSWLQRNTGSGQTSRTAEGTQAWIPNN